MAEGIKSYHDLQVYQAAFETALEVFRLTESFPKKERFRLADQMNRASRSVCANLAEAWRKRRYRAAFIAKISDAESEACEMQVWISMATQMGYIDEETGNRLNMRYHHILAQLVRIIQTVDKWLIRGPV